MMKWFSMNELTRSDTAERLKIDNTPNERQEACLRLLVEKVLDPVRTEWESPLRITSGYRSAKLNRAVGGAPTSQHRDGMAADVQPVQGDVDDLWMVVRHMVDDGLIEVDQCLNERNSKGSHWLHISYCEGGNRNQFLHLMDGAVVDE